MPKTIQLRNVPDKVHRTLEERAAKAGLSLSAYVAKELERIASRPTVQEVIERAERRRPVKTSVSSAQVIREFRDAGK